MNVYPTCYFPPIPWFAAMIREDAVLIETSQHYRKQQYTNRMRVRIANRIMPLVIPLERIGSNKPIKDKRIANHEKWQRGHWLTLASAYRSSPYFEYYEDRLERFYRETFDFIIDMNEAIRELLFDILDIEAKVSLTEAYESPDFYAHDYRDAFDPSGKALPDWFEPVSYPQVFGDDFTPGLSIFDLICNEGPHSRQILRDSFKS